MKLSVIVLLVLFCSCLHAEEVSSQPVVYSQIKDIYHPTDEDYRLVQKYLSFGERPEITRMKDYNYEHVARNLKIIGETSEELPRYEVIPVNCDMSEKNNCIMIYSTFNRNYPKGLERLVEHIRESDFKGHILCRLGGWPDAEGGSLVLAHVPYAFKVSFFKEAQRLGFKRAFWLDTAVVPLVSLNEIFKMIEEKGYFIMGNSHMIGPYINESAARALGVTIDEAQHIPSCSAGIFGVDFSNEKGKKVIDLWYKAALDKDAFFSSRSDQTALSVILYQMGMNDFVSIKRMPHTESGDEIKPDSLLLLDRLFTYSLKPKGNV